MKKYTIEIVIEEGNDEFWEEIKGTGCDEVIDGLVATLAQEGWKAEIKLKKFEDV